MTNKGRHCPAHIIIGRAIQWNMPSGVAGLICGEAAGLCLAKPDAKKSHATRDRYLTGFPPSARMTGWGDNGESEGDEFFWEDNGK
ncbi:hypothetical protein [Candidatus Spongiihabitans sp.]|uniref:hypothetical protein n=1 Tax=Candidatus Spongiihabitans sp. TaxID=3101308 RepID=UPI003C7A33B0